MSNIYDRYTYRITWSEEDQEHVGLCSELPSISWLEKSAEDALAGIRKIAKECVADMQAQDEVVPEPLCIKKYSGKFMVRVTPDLHRILTMQAVESGVSLNRLISTKLAG
jgi:predicted HicB family RNase H-like nuclease